MSAASDRKVVVITGASGGIGAALARLLGSAGQDVVLAARRAGELAAVARDSGDAALAVTTDVTDRRSVEALRDRAIAHFGHVDVWVNNAGRGITKPALQLTDADFDDMMTVNVKSVLYGMQAIAPHFVERGAGHIINVSSFLGRVPLASIRSAYNAAKAAVNALTANVRADLAVSHPGIHVSLVMPGLVATDFARNALGNTAGNASGSVSGSASGSAVATPIPTPPRSAPGAATPQTAEEVAAVIAGVIANPVAEVFTNPASAEIARRYFEDVAAFERGMNAGFAPSKR
ncbi:MAG: SDR family oxidoreductase [Gemmatimonadaceae bacterium]